MSGFSMSFIDPQIVANAQGKAVQTILRNNKHAIAEAAIKAMPELSEKVLKLVLADNLDWVQNYIRQNYESELYTQFETALKSLSKKGNLDLNGPTPAEASRGKKSGGAAARKKQQPESDSESSEEDSSDESEDEEERRRAEKKAAKKAAKEAAKKEAERQKEAEDWHVAGGHKLSSKQRKKLLQEAKAAEEARDADEGEEAAREELPSQSEMKILSTYIDKQVNKVLKKPDAQGKTLPAKVTQEKEGHGLVGLRLKRKQTNYLLMVRSLASKKTSFELYDDDNMVFRELMDTEKVHAQSREADNLLERIVVKYYLRPAVGMPSYSAAASKKK